MDRQKHPNNEIEMLIELMAGMDKCISGYADFPESPGRRSLRKQCIAIQKSAHNLHKTFHKPSSRRIDGTS